MTKTEEIIGIVFMIALAVFTWFALPPWATGLCCFVYLGLIVVLMIFKVITS